MGVLALDLSKRSTGYAHFREGGNTAHYGSWPLGTEYTSDGQVFAKLHQNLSELRQVMPFDSIYHEEAINPGQLQGHTNIHSLKLASGLAAHVESFGYAMRCRVHAVNIASWRKDFIGPQKRGTKRVTLKSLTIERCNQLGFKPRTDDEADAIGLLTYALDCYEGIRAPWTANEVLRPPLGMAT